MKRAKSLSPLFFIVFLLFLNACGGGEAENRSLSESKKVVVIQVDERLLQKIPGDYEVFYIYPIGYGKMLDRNLAMRHHEGQAKKYVCYTFLDDAKLFEESKRCISRFQADSGPIDYILPQESDEMVYMGGRLRSYFGLKSGLDERHAAYLSDKIAMKNKLLSSDSSIKTARYFEVTAQDFQGDYVSFIKTKLQEKLGVDWKKAVMKPSSEAGSIGVFTFNNDDELSKNLEKFYRTKIRNLIQNGGSVVVEEFVEGEILRMDGFVKNGKLVVNFPSAYTIPPLEFYSKGNPQLTLSRVGDTKRYDVFAQKVVNALDYKDGIIHLEAIESTDGSIYFLEIAGRTGGTLAYTLAAQGFDSELAYMYTNLGIEVPLNINKRPYASVSLFVPREIARDTESLVLQRLYHTPLTSLISYTPLSPRVIKGVGERLKPYENIYIWTFMNEDHELVKREVWEFYRSLDVSVYLEGGSQGGRRIDLINQKWQ